MGMLKKIKDYLLGPSYIAMIIRQIMIAFVLSYLIISFILLPCVVEGSSMYPTLQEGDYGYSFIISRNISINRFDIVVIQIDGKDELLVKRLIGLPNEKIVYKDNKLYVNDEYVEEDFLDSDIDTDDLEVVLGEDEYFFLGDNRNVSRDSRFYGAISKQQILSTHVFVIKPLSHFGIKK